MPNHLITNSQRHHAWSQALSKTQGYAGYIRTTPLSVNIGLNGESIDELFDELYPKVSNRAKRPTKQAFQVAMLAIQNACRESAKHQERTGFICPTTNTRHRGIKRYKQNDFTINKLSSVLSDLAYCRLLERHNGFRGEAFSSGLATLWMPSKKAQELVYKLEGSTECLPFRKTSELVWLKTSSGKLSDYTDNSETNAMRSELRESNELRASATWAYRPAFRIRSDSGEMNLSDHYTPIHQEDLRFKRQFLDDFNIGGRFYGGVQQLRQVERSTIIVNGEATVEYDIKSMHTRMLYNLKGLPAPIDGYDIDGFDRPTAKKLALVALNADSERSAAGALVESLGFTWKESIEALERFREAHKTISEHLFSSSWRILQYLDSELARAVQMSAFELGIPIIPIHDSFVVSLRGSDNLKAIIQREYSKRFGFEPVIEASNS